TACRLIASARPGEPSPPSDKAASNAAPRLRARPSLANRYSASFIVKSSCVDLEGSMEIKSGLAVYTRLMLASSLLTVNSPSCGYSPLAFPGDIKIVSSIVDSAEQVL